MALESPMSEEKKSGITHAIRQRLGFEDSRLWKRFSARRLELIDTLDLSSKKASDQEDEIKRVAEILRVEFRYDVQFFPDFDKLVRAAVQSVRRNRKRGTKTGRANVKRRLVESDATTNSSPYTPTQPDPGFVEKNQFLSEITNLNTDGFDAVYDMSYSTSRIISTSDRSRAAIDSIIRPNNLERKMSNPAIQLPPLQKVTASSPRQQENEKALSAVRLSLLWLMKRSKSCLSSASSHKNESFKVIGKSAVATVCALMLESSFSGLSSTSVEYLRDRISSAEFQARFYKSLEPECSISRALDDETAVSTLETLVGCCVKDFGFDAVLYLVGEAFYLSILIEYPLVSRSSVPFKRMPGILPALEPFQRDAVKQQPGPGPGPGPLSNLAAIATELRSHAPTASPATDASTPSTAPNLPAKRDNFLKLVPLLDPSNDRKHVKLRFLSSSLNFTFPTKNSAPPRFVEIVDNARQAFKLTENQVYGLRNCKSGHVINTDFDLEQIFAQESEIELEIFTQRFSPIPFSEIASAITPNPSTDDRSKIVLPLPVRQNVPPVLPSPIDRSHSPGIPRMPFLPKFQPLL
ncbi:hypothetical protein OY671_006232 [Metschnikowia pulcherrima]|nr:hypothetical protein OY671_006232 [Metschnikowia pulcherrima]